jgi:peptidoglycan/LPS O-acetylase OafA/YrhL
VTHAANADWPAPDWCFRTVYSGASRSRPAAPGASAARTSSTLGANGGPWRATTTWATSTAHSIGSRATELSRISSRGVSRRFAFLLLVAAPFGLALLDIGHTSKSWWLVAAIPVVLYCLYAAGLRWWLPTRSARPARTRSDRPSTREADWLLLIRGLAAGLVFVFHSGIVLDHDFTWGHSQWAWLIYSPPWLGMILFFTLSGYLMGKGFYTGRYDLSRTSVVEYLRNRFLRIFPLMAVVGLLAILWQSPSLLRMPQLGVRMILFGFNGYQATDSIGAFWSLSTEWQFYLLVPAAFAVVNALLREKARLPVVTALVLFGGLIVRSYSWSFHPNAHGWAFYVYTPLFDNLDVFLLGFLANWWVTRLERARRLLATAWPMLLLGIYLAYAFVSYQALGVSNPHWLRTFVVILPGASALALIPVLVGCEALNRIERSRSVPRHRTASVLYWIGALTYPVYLIHSSILDGVQKGIPHDPYLVRWLVATVLVVFVAWVLHITVEQAALRWRKDVVRPEGAVA